MCAIDVFYVPFLTESDVTIDSVCHYCDSAIHICVKGGAITEIEPLTTVVWDSAATYDCPWTNFFCGKKHLQLWLEGVPEEPGQVLDLSKALERGMEAAARIRSELAMPQPIDNHTIIRESTITCPNCHTQSIEVMPLDACVFFFECGGCGVLLRPHPGDCCVFCSYGSVACPPRQS